MELNSLWQVRTMFKKLAKKPYKTRSSPGINLTSLGIMVKRSWEWLSIRGMRSFEHVHIVTKWLCTMNLTTKGAEKVLLQQKKP